jgi:transposase
MTSTISLEEHLKEIAQVKAAADTATAALRNEVRYLEEQLEWFRKQIFGTKSEKIIEPREDSPYLPGFEQFFSKVEEEKKQEIPSHQRKKPKRQGQDSIVLPDNLPVERQFIDIPEEDKVCPETGLPLIKIGEEVTSKIAHRPGSYFIKQIVRIKYALPKESSESGIVVPDLPDSLLNRCQADESLLANILVKKFGDHLPLYRQAEIMGREGIVISRQLLSKWVLRVGNALKPLYDAMFYQILATNNIFYDETPIDMLSPGKGKTHQAYMWVIVGGESSNPGYRVYDFRTNRCHYNAAERLKGYQGRLHSDKYGAYEVLAKTKEFTWCPCWSHIRRKFFEAENGDPIFRAWILRLIKYLFMLEKVAWARSEEERLRIRQEKEIPIIDNLIEKITDKQVNGKILPKSKFNTALGYFSGLIPYLKNYCKFPWARLDNNIAERAVRPVAIGRKNWLFVGNETGGEAAAVILSLVQTARAMGINPQEYLEDVMRRIMSYSFQKLYELLPDYWLKARNNSL